MSIKLNQCIPYHDSVWLLSLLLEEMDHTLLYQAYSPYRRKSVSCRTFFLNSSFMGLWIRFIPLVHWSKLFGLTFTSSDCWMDILYLTTTRFIASKLKVFNFNDFDIKAYTVNGEKKYKLEDRRAIKIPTIL